MYIVYILLSIYVMYSVFLRTHCHCEKIISQSAINKVILFYSISIHFPVK